jgi:hypothetical protein
MVLAGRGPANFAGKEVRRGGNIGLTRKSKRW